MKFEDVARLLDDIPAQVAWRRPDSVIKETTSWFQVITPSSKILPLNGIYRSIVTTEEIDASIESAVEEFSAHQTPFRWIVTNSSRPLDIGSRLQNFSFKKDHEALGLAAEASRILSATGNNVIVTDLEEEHLDEWVDATVAGWGNPESYSASLRADVYRSLREKSGNLRYFSAFVGSEIVGTGNLRICAKSAHLLGSCVKPSFRGRGIYRALVAKRAEVATEYGLELITTHAMVDSSAPILKNMGFREFSRSTQYSHA